MCEAPSMLRCEHCHEQHTEAHRYCPMTGRIVAPHRFFIAGTVLDGKYRLGRVLGAGGMGAVLEVTHELLGKRMAAKLMFPEISRDREMAARMAREAQVASTTGHPNVAQVTDMGFAADGAMYLIMELLEGRTLGEIIRTEAPLPIRRAAALLDQLLAGLGAVHRRGVVHRDLKPDNLMVIVEDGNEVLKILDFGISKVLDDKDVRVSLTSTGMVLGTPHYMSPEQARGARDLDHRADLYAAGALLYTMITGQRPLEAAGYNAMIALILEGRVAPPSQRVAGIPPELDALVLKALARDPAQRFADAQAFRQALASFALVAPPRAAPAEQRLSAPRPASPAVQATTTAPPEAPPPVAQHDDSRFRPPDEVELPLELATVGPRRVVGAADEAGPAAVGTFFEAPSRRGFVLRAVIIVGALCAVAVAWFVFRDALSGASATESPAETVLLLVEVTPADADVYVDGVLQHTKPILLPRGEREFAVRVERRGFLTQTLRLRADRTRSVQVQLRRLLHR